MKIFSGGKSAFKGSAFHRMAIFATVALVGGSCGYLPNESSSDYRFAEDLIIKCAVMSFDAFVDEEALSRSCDESESLSTTKRAQIYADAVSTSSMQPASVAFFVKGLNKTGKTIRYSTTTSLNGEPIPFSGNGNPGGEDAAEFVMGGFGPRPTLELVEGTNKLLFEVFPTPKEGNAAVLSVEFAFDVTAATTEP